MNDMRTLVTGNWCGVNLISIVTTLGLYTRLGRIETAA